MNLKMLRCLIGGPPPKVYFLLDRSRMKRKFKSPKIPKVFNPGRRTTRRSRLRRPVVSDQSMHVVMRSSLARGRLSLHKNEAKIQKLIRQMSVNHGVRIYKFANVGNHIHIHLRVTRPIKWKGFISGLAGGIARSVGFLRVPEEKSVTVGRGGFLTGGQSDRSRGFWDARPFSRRVYWGRDFRTVRDYVTLNCLEAQGVVPSRKLLRKGKSWRRIVELFSDDLLESTEVFGRYHQSHHWT